MWIMNEDENIINSFICSIIINVIIKVQILIFSVVTIFIIAIYSFTAGALPFTSKITLKSYTTGKELIGFSLTLAGNVLSIHPYYFSLLWPTMCRYIVEVKVEGSTSTLQQCNCVHVSSTQMCHDRVTGATNPVLPFLFIHVFEYLILLLVQIFLTFPKHATNILLKNAH